MAKYESYVEMVFTSDPPRFKAGDEVIAETVAGDITRLLTEGKVYTIFEFLEPCNVMIRFGNTLHTYDSRRFTKNTH
jgi:hypothetical protein